MRTQGRLCVVAVSMWTSSLVAGCVDAHREAAPAAAPEAVSSWRVAAGSQALPEIAERFSVIARDERGFTIYAPGDRVQELLALEPAAQMLEQDVADEWRRLEKRSPTWLVGYRSFSEVEQLLQQVAQQHPDFARLESYGSSSDGRPLYALKLSDNVASDEAEPELMITAATHGDEIITVEVVLRLLEELVQGYGSNARLTAMIDGHELYFLPVISPDSFVARSRYVDGVDPNRDYPWPDQPDRSPVKPIAGVMSFFAAHDFAGSLDFHAFGQLVMYPWAYTYDTIANGADLQALDDLATGMAADNGYTPGQISQVIYVAQGSSADYYYWQKQTLAYGIEIATTKAPPSSTIPYVVDEAREMVWKFIEHF